MYDQDWEQRKQLSNLERVNAMSSPQDIAPAMTGGTPVCSYECNECRAILTKDLQSTNPTLQYLYALIVFPPRYHEAPIMYIMAEQTIVSPEVLRNMPTEMRAAMAGVEDLGVYLTIYDDDGKTNLGSDELYENLEKFEAEALSVMKSAMSIKSPLKKINDIREGGSFGGGGCLGVIVGGIGLGVSLWGLSHIIGG